MPDFVFQATDGKEKKKKERNIQHCIEENFSHIVVFTA
jgi:hypothetical protein